MPSEEGTEDMKPEISADAHRGGEAEGSQCRQGEREAEIRLHVTATRGKKEVYFFHCISFTQAK